MQQLALQTPSATPYRGTMTTLERDARDLGHAHGGGSLLAFDNLLSDSKAAAKAPHITAASSSATPLAAMNAHSGASDFGVSDIAGPALSIAAGALTGGPVGAVTAAAGELFEALSGGSLLGHALSLFDDTAPAATLARANQAYIGAAGLR